MKGNGLASIEKDMGYKYGPMEPNTRDIGLIIKLQEKENLLMLMGIYMKEIGKMIKQMAMVFTSISKLQLDIRDIGRTICSMDQEYNFMRMEINMKECSSREKEVVRGHTILLKDRYIRANGVMEKYRDMGYVHGRMEKSTREIGRTTKRTVMVYILGRMVESIEDFIEMTKSTG